MDKKEVLKSMVNNLINDNQAQASIDMHKYLTQKMKEVMSPTPSTEPAPAADNSADE